MRKVGLHRSLAFSGALVALAALLWLACSGTPVGRPAAARGGMSAQRLARLTSWMQGYVDARKLAGLSTLIARRGEVVYFEAVGLRDIAAGAPMTRDTIFRIYSMTKPITSVAVLMLFERGDLLLSDPVSRYLPEFADLRVLADPLGPLDETVALERPVTIRDLLTHTSGLIYESMEGGPLAEAYRRAGMSSGWTSVDLATWVKRLASLPLAHQPGTAWHYGMSTDLLGHLVAVVSGMPFDRFLRENVFRPLRMEDTDFSVPAPKLGRFAALYGPAPEGGLRVIAEPGRGGFDAAPTFLSGGGGLVSTAPDYLRFAQMLLNGGELDGVRILGRKTVELMTQDHLTPREHDVEFLRRYFPGSGFGLGVSVVNDVAATGLPGSVGQYGWAGAASTSFWIDPKEELVVIQMTQFMPPFQYALPSETRALVYQAIAD